MRNRLIWLAGLFAAEMLAIVLVFQVFSSVECRLTEIETACRTLRGGMVRGICALVAIGLFLWFRPTLRQQLIAAAQSGSSGRFWAVVHAAGLALIFLPWMSADPATLNAQFQTYFLTLTAGGVLAALGGILWALPHDHLWRWLRQGGGALALVVGIGLLIPDLAAALDPLWWSLDGLLVATFYAVAVVLAVLGNHVLLDPDISTIGTKDFLVEVAGSCSGIEGFALITGFLAIYAMLIRDTLRQRRFWLLVFPLALLTSWVFNVIRISVLILIGAHISPELAVNGFHSFAGWLFFTVLALGVLWVVQVLPWLHRAPDTKVAAKDLPPLRQDLVAAQIAPFLVFMLSGLLVNTFWQQPILAYPLQTAMMAAALWLFRAPILRLEWRLDPLAVLVGLVVAVGWIGAAPETSGASPVATLGTAAFAAWVLARILGTALCVPVIEELFFRGYLLGWLDTGRPVGRVLAVIASSLFFAILHGRIIEAGLAGVAFALLTLRRGRVADAIVAHAVANTAIAIAALMSGDWSLI